jgi:GDPmannose 4,6-dehydratase
MRRALITGILGQDGAYLARLLLKKGYQVYGAYRRTSSFNTWRLRELGILDNPNLFLSGSDVTDQGSCTRLLELSRPHEVYNLAAQSFVGASFDQPMLTTQINGLGALHLLEAIRTVDRTIRFYQASTAEMFGLVQSVPQSEDTPFYPRSPYAVAKLYAHGIAINYRESYDIFAACGILFNHESPLRGMEFVTRKITDAVACVAIGGDAVLELGNLGALRDWGYAEDYVEGMWRLLQADTPDVCIFATGHTRSVRDFATMAFGVAGLGVTWHGHGDDEHAICEDTKRVVVRVAPHLRRPAEVDLLIGDFSKAERTLGWRPKTGLEELCAMMVDADIMRQRKILGATTRSPVKASGYLSGQRRRSRLNRAPSPATPVSDRESVIEFVP